MYFHTAANHLTIGYIITWFRSEHGKIAKNIKKFLKKKKLYGKLYDVVGKEKLYL